MTDATIPRLAGSRIAAAMVAIFILIGSYPTEGASVSFDKLVYPTTVGNLTPVSVLISYDAGDPGSLFSYGVQIKPLDVLGAFTVDSVSVPAALNFNGVLGLPANLSDGSGGSPIGAKGTIDLGLSPTVPYTGSAIATFGLVFDAPGSYEFDADFFNTLGATEDIFVAGTGEVLDAGLSFGSTTVRVAVIPEPTVGLLLALGLTAGWMRRRR